MKYNYPVKYAIMPIYEQTNNEKENKNIVGYVASKCYIVSELNEYHEDGHVDKKYEVVFPFQKDDIINYTRWEREYPKFTYVNVCTNSEKTDKVYKDYAAAKEEAEKLNREMFKKSLAFVISSKDVAKEIKTAEELFKYRLSSFEKLSNLIEEKTKDMKPNHVPSKQYIIVSYPDRDVIEPISLYDFIKKSEDQPFIAYNIDKSYYKDLLNQVRQLKRSKRLKINSKRTNLLLQNNIKHNVVQIINYNQPDDSGSYYLSYSNRINLNYSKNMMDLSMSNSNSDLDYKKIRVYTMETYSDIINAYQLVSSIPKEEIAKTKVLIKG